MRAVHVGIGHNYNLMIPEFADIEVSFSYTGSEGRNYNLYLIVVEHFVEPCLFHVQQFSPQRKDCLIAPVSPLFRRSAC